jgi:Na+-transporting NADH:ubiquinone oxidoreductase subunit B
MGETSALACLIGALILVATGVGSWRTDAGHVPGHHRHGHPAQRHRLGHQPLDAVPFWWHMVMGGWAFAMVFMVTDPVTSPFPTPAAGSTGCWSVRWSC